MLLRTRTGNVFLIHAVRKDFSLLTAGLAYLDRPSEIFDVFDPEDPKTIFSLKLPPEYKENQTFCVGANVVFEILRETKIDGKPKQKAGTKRIRRI